MADFELSIELDRIGSRFFGRAASGESDRVQLGMGPPRDLHLDGASATLIGEVAVCDDWTSQTTTHRRIVGSDWGCVSTERSQDNPPKGGLSFVTSPDVAALIRDSLNPYVAVGSSLIAIFGILRGWPGDHPALTIAGLSHPARD